MNTLQSFQLNGKVVIVTGGAGFYGKPIATALAEAGAKVIVASRDKKKCEDFAATLVAQGYDAEGKALDLGNEQSIKSCIEEIVEQHNRIDILINNAVSREGFKNLDEMKKEEMISKVPLFSLPLMLQPM